LCARQDSNLQPSDP